MGGISAICMVQAVLFIVGICVVQASDSPVNLDLETDFLVNASDVTGDISLDVTPAHTVTIIMYSESVISINYTLRCHARSTTHALKIYTLNHEVAFLRGQHEYNVSCAELQDSDKSDVGEGNFTVHSGEFNLTVYADQIGRTWLVFDTFSVNGTITDEAFENVSVSGEGRRVSRYKVVVIRLRRLIDYIFRAIVYVFVIGTTIGMGCKTDLDVVKKVLKKPIAPLIGLFCQYVGMPLVSLAITYIFPYVYDFSYTKRNT